MLPQLPPDPKVMVGVTTGAFTLAAVVTAGVIKGTLTIALGSGTDPGVLGIVGMLITVPHR